MSLWAKVAFRAEGGVLHGWPPLIVHHHRGIITCAEMLKKNRDKRVFSKNPLALLVPEVPDLCERYDHRRREERAVKHQRNNPKGLDVNEEETTVALSYFHRRWVSKSSWGVCVSRLAAHRVQLHMRRRISIEKWPNTMDNCCFCRSKCYVPKREAFPAPLLRLPREVTPSSPLLTLVNINNHKVVSEGTPQLACIRCSPTDVMDKLQALPEDMQERGMLAFDYLMTKCATSDYAEFCPGTQAFSSKWRTRQDHLIQLSPSSFLGVRVVASPVSYQREFRYGVGRKDFQVQERQDGLHGEAVVTCLGLRV